MVMAYISGPEEGHGEAGDPRPDEPVGAKRSRPNSVGFHDVGSHRLCIRELRLLDVRGGPLGDEAFD